MVSAVWLALVGWDVANVKGKGSKPELHPQFDVDLVDISRAEGTSHSANGHNANLESRKLVILHLESIYVNQKI